LKVGSTFYISLTVTLLYPIRGYADADRAYAEHIMRCKVVLFMVTQCQCSHPSQRKRTMCNSHAHNNINACKLTNNSALCKTGSTYCERKHGHLLVTCVCETNHRLSRTSSVLDEQHPALTVTPFRLWCQQRFPIPFARRA
jgi:hypothetical protein